MRPARGPLSRNAARPRCPRVTDTSAGLTDGGLDCTNPAASASPPERRSWVRLTTPAAHGCSGRVRPRSVPNTEEGTSSQQSYCVSGLAPTELEHLGPPTREASLAGVTEVPDLPGRPVLDVAGLLPGLLKVGADVHDAFERTGTPPGSLA